MLRNRSRAMTKQQPIMAADHQTTRPSPPIHNQTLPVSPFFASPRFFFTPFLTKGVCDTDPTTTSPTSILQSTKLFSFGNPFGLENQNSFSKTRTKFSVKNMQKPEVGIVAALVEEKTSDHIYKPKPSLTLKIHIPPPTENGEKDFFALVSTGPLSLSEMEMSEEYTCVITRGPNPKTTHIFGNCVLKSCGDVETMESGRNDRPKSSFVDNFLSCCHTCNKSLGEEDDIYMYRGEKAFCSEECRGQEMILDWEC